MALKFGVIGLGGLGRLQAQALADADGVDLVAGADVAVESREAFDAEFGGPSYDDHDALLAAHGDVLDAVTIVTPHELHFEQAMDCLEAGLHVHLEKPMVTTTADGLALLAAARERDLLLQVGYQRHFHPAYREIERLVASGRIGEVHMAACSLAQDWIDGQLGTWRTTPALSGGGQLIDSGSHLLDVLLWVTDAEPRTVAAVADHRGHDVDVNTAISALLEGPDRQITASIGVSGDGDAFEEHLSLWGTAGRITYADGRLLVAENGVEYESEFAAPDYLELTRAKLAAFADAVESGGESPVPGEFGLRVTRLTEAAFLASETGETVDAAALPRTEPTAEAELQTGED